MPTGYTAGILDGDITTFPEFAKLCMRAFGATIHMKEEPLDKSYEKRVPSTYHSDNIEIAKDLKKSTKSMTDEQILIMEKENIKRNIKFSKERVEKAEKDKAKLMEILTKVNQFTPPTKEHEMFKEFMAQQIVDTIKHDCDVNYYIEEIEKKEAKLENLDAESIRNEKIEKYDRDIEYHTKGNAEEIKRCEDANKWVDDLLSALEEE